MTAPCGSWSIAVLQAPTLEGLAQVVPQQPSITGEDLAAFGGTGAADPFAIQRADGWYVFFECFMANSKNATIACARSADLVAWEQLGIVLQAPHHLSYPFVFEHDGSIFMMPESKSVRRVDLYRAIDFPMQWKFEKTLLRGRLMDASMVKYRDRYWIFAGWRSYWLRIFHAEHPLGPWRSHWLPTIGFYNKASTRPGGRPILLDGQLIRLSQDNVQYYGHQLRAWQVTTLNRFWYRDRAILDRPILQPSGVGWNGRQMHHADIHPQPDGHLIAFVDGA
ncbi:MAG: hypothetical protein JO053_10715 [Acidobacteria bacterium]|nr:hypothetical protein [Acidobacteriota bacterium]